MSERSKGTLVRRLDSDKLLEIGVAILNQQFGHDFMTEKGIHVEPLVLVALDEQGGWGEPRLATIGTEGVGWQESEKDGLVPFYVEYGYGGSGCHKVSVHPRVIKECLTDEVVDLSEFIRTFGSRLDSNFYTWKSAIGSAEQVFSTEEVSA
jgi:hypothetical protein